MNPQFHLFQKVFQIVPTLFFRFAFIPIHSKRFERDLQLTLQPLGQFLFTKNILNFFPIINDIFSN